MTRTLSSVLRPCESLYQCYECVPLWNTSTYSRELLDEDALLRDGCLETTSTKTIINTVATVS